MQVLQSPFYRRENWGSERPRVPITRWCFSTLDAKYVPKECFQMPSPVSLFSEQKSKPRSSPWPPGASPSCSPSPPWSYLGRGNSLTAKCSAGPCGLTTPTGLRTWLSWPSWCTSSRWPSSGKRPAGRTRAEAFLLASPKAHSLFLVFVGTLARPQC